MDEIIERMKSLPEEQMSAWRDLHGINDGASFTIRWETSPRWTPEQRDAVAAGICDLCMGAEDAEQGIRLVVMINRHLGVMLACAAARSVMRLVDPLDERPMYAIESAEKLVMKKISRQECKDNARGALTSWSEDRITEAPLAAESVAEASVFNDMDTADEGVAYRAAHSVR